MSKKVMQTATVEVNIVATQEQMSSVSAGLVAITAVYNRKGDYPYQVEIYPSEPWYGFVLVHAEIAYTAMGANRNDIDRKIAEFVEAEYVSVARSAHIEKLTS